MAPRAPAEQGVGLSGPCHRHSLLLLPVRGQPQPHHCPRSSSQQAQSAASFPSQALTAMRKSPHEARRDLLLANHGLPPHSLTLSTQALLEVALTLLLPAPSRQPQGKWGGQDSTGHMLWQDQPHQMPRDKRDRLVPVCAVAERHRKIKGRGQTAKIWSLLEC